jgi:hypothetical protein
MDFLADPGIIGHEQSAGRRYPLKISALASHFGPLGSTLT